MGWVEHTIWWHAYPLGLAGAPIHTPDDHPGPRLRRLLGWLDHAVELGANGLLLGPVFASSSHGYDTTDHFAVDPRLGGERDLTDLIVACHDRGLRVLLDGVFSHVGYEHPTVAAALRDGPASAAGALLDIDWDADGGPAPRVFEGHGGLVRLRHGSEAAVTLAADVMTHWLDRGIDGWRLDAAYSVPAQFWAESLARVRARHPDAWFLGEIIHGDYAEFVRASTVNSVTQYELWKAIWSSLLDGNFFELEYALGRHAQMLDTFLPQTFVGNHDVTRIATTVGRDKALVALTVLMTVAGIPSVYYGDELGFTGTKEDRVGGDDAIRPPLPDSPADQPSDGEAVLRAHQALIGLRRRHPWLTTSRAETVQLTNTRFVYRAVSADGADALQIELDVEGTPSAVVRESGEAVLWQL